MVNFYDKLGRKNKRGKIVYYVNTQNFIIFPIDFRNCSSTVKFKQKKTIDSTVWRTFTCIKVFRSLLRILRSSISNGKCYCFVLLYSAIVTTRIVGAIKMKQFTDIKSTQIFTLTVHVFSLNRYCPEF